MWSGVSRPSREACRIVGAIASLGGLVLITGCAGGVTDPKGPIGAGDLTLLVDSMAIMLAIVWWGYLVGVIMGFVGACLMFAFSYGRVGVMVRLDCATMRTLRSARSSFGKKALAKYSPCTFTGRTSNMTLGFLALHRASSWDK